MTDEFLTAIRKRAEDCKRHWATAPGSLSRLNCETLAYLDREALLAEVDRLKGLVDSLAERVFVQSEILSRHAERKANPAASTDRRAD